MKTFIQTASLDELRRLWPTGVVDGITISVLDLADLEPALDPRDGRHFRTRVSDMGREFAIPICVPVPVVAAEHMYRDARELAKASDHVVLQVPLIEDAIIPIRQLVADGIRVCASYVYNSTQAYMAGKIGATMVMVPVDDLDAHGHPSAQIVGEIRDVLDQAGLECELGVSSPKGSTHFAACLLAGTDIVCMTPDTMRSLTAHALTDRGIDRYMNEISKRHFRPRGM